LHEDVNAAPSRPRQSREGTDSRYPDGQAVLVLQFGLGDEDSMTSA
jgi:hypothetical protein